jgi:Interleukin-like EMT inducer
MALETGYIVLIAGKDDFIANMTESARKAIESLGSALIRNVNYRDSWCIIGEKGAAVGTVPEFYRSAHLGPTEKISKIYNLGELRKCGADRRGSFPAKDYLPSDGWWLRRRRNDGVLCLLIIGFKPCPYKLLS